MTETVQRLAAAGATVLRQDEWQGRPHHVVMADPEGNEFCVVGVAGDRATVAG